MKDRTQIDALFSEIEAMDSLTGATGLSGAELAQIDDSVCFYRITKLSYDEDYPRREAFENAIAALDDEAFNFVYILTGTARGVEMCVGVARSGRQSQGSLRAADLGDKLANMIRGNFGGSELTRMNSDELERVLRRQCDGYLAASYIVGVPSVNDPENSADNGDFQGIDRLINSMSGDEWRLVIIVEPVPRAEAEGLRQRVCDVSDMITPFVKESVQDSRGTNTSEQTGTNSSRSSEESSNEGWNKSETYEISNSDKTNKGKKVNYQEQKSGGTNSGKTVSDGTSESRTTGENFSHASTREHGDKRAAELARYIDEELLDRLRLGRARGLYRVSVRCMASDVKTADRLASSITSLFQGDSSSFSPLRAYKVNVETEGRQILSTLRGVSSPRGADLRDAALLFCRPLDSGALAMSTYLTSKEVSLYAGLPQKEVPGISLTEAVEFGLNRGRDPEDPIPLGPMIHRGRELRGCEFSLSRDALKKHVFIGGVTGSGKTTTCHRLIREARIPFLVIEPAKTEYRCLLKDLDFDDLIVLTPGNENVAPLRLNPFELLPGEIISSHIDMVKAAFTASFPMEASMPQLLEESIIDCYRDKHWNVLTNENEMWGADAFDRDDAFPRMQDLTEKFEKIVKEKQFGDRLQGEYLGSLRSRISNLTVGAKGAMLNCARSIDFTKLIHRRVVIEMEEMRSPEDKALVMGFILSCMSMAIKMEYKKDKEFRHLTLIEEAHRLLAKPDFSENARKSAVETFTDLLAEVRKYGEGLAVIDQIPNKLAAEVLKNTNTKIIHKLFAQDDKDAVGDTMLMDDKQRGRLSALAAGDAVVFSDEMEKPVLIHVRFSEADRRVADTEATDADVKERFTARAASLGKALADRAASIVEEDRLASYPREYKTKIFAAYDEYMTVISSVARAIFTGSAAPSEAAASLLERLAAMDEACGVEAGTAINILIRRGELLLRRTSRAGAADEERAERLRRALECSPDSMNAARLTLRPYAGVTAQGLYVSDAQGAAASGQR